MLRTALMISAAAMLVLAVPTAAQQSGAQTSPNAAKAQPGVRTVTEGPAAVVEFYAVRSADVRATDLIGMDVRNLRNEDIGEVEDIVLDDGKNVRAIIMGVGGFLGIGDRSVAVTPRSVVIVKEADGSEHALVNATKEHLTTAPEFKVQPRRAASKG